MRTRFAPSVTGYLHLGHVLHMVYVWGVARMRGAEVLTRVEDHDRSRARPEFEASILESAEWLGFISEHGLRCIDAQEPSAYRQSDCGAVYAEVLERLRIRGLVYGCACTRRDILAHQTNETNELCYPGCCVDEGLPLEGHIVRFRIPQGEVAFEDLRMGAQHQNPPTQCGDMALRDREGQWSYQFCCVCDDIRHGIDLVVRGEDIRSSTGRQIRLFQALGHESPTYYHHPLLLDTDGKKLSKRQRSESVEQMRNDGLSAEEIIGRALLAGDLISELKPCSADVAINLVGQ